MYTASDLANQWIEEWKDLCEPKRVVVCNGSEGEYAALCDLLVEKGTFIRLNESLRPNSFLARSCPEDVARVEEQTFICSVNESDAGPTNHWMEPKKMKALLREKMRGCMRGRVMYVVPFAMGPLDSPLVQLGFEITDSPYVVVNMHKMTRVNADVLERIENRGDFIRCVHSVGCPLEEGEEDRPWPCNKEKYITHFPETDEVISYGSGYGGNALLPKKCVALRLASVKAKKEGWMAEHMLIVSAQSPKGEKRYIAAAFPSACGKTNLAMMQPSVPGWDLKTVGDDIAWMRFDEEGKLFAVNPEYGFFGVATGTSYETNPHAMESIARDTIFTNVALTPDGDVWWEGMTKEPPESLTDWKGQPWTPESEGKAAHPNSRFTVNIQRCSILDEAAFDPKGVPIDILLFGGRRSDTVPLCVEARDWEEGVLLAAMMSSQMTAAAKGVVGQLRHDPMAMLPFCGYHMGDYFRYWLEVGQNSKRKLPKIYYVNWFRTNPEGDFIWPGFGENIRVIDWMFERKAGRQEGREHPLGMIPVEGEVASEEALFETSSQQAKREFEEWKTYSQKFGEAFPEELRQKIDEMQTRCGV